MESVLKNNGGRLGVVLLIAFAVENWRGEREWIMFKDKQGSKEVSFNVNKSEVIDSL